MLPSIPPHISAAIFPCPTLPVAEFLRFKFPFQLPKSSANQDVDAFWSSDAPNILEFTSENLKNLPIPSAAMLSALQDSSESQNDRKKAAISVVYAHVPTERHNRYPLWIFTYWITMSSLREHVKVPWSNAEAFMSSNTSKWRSDDFRKLCMSARNALLCLPWCGDVRGFSDNTPTAMLASYLSHSWLKTSHIYQQLDLLRYQLYRVRNEEYEILGPEFFHKIRLLYTGRNESPYPGSANKQILAVGSDLANATRRGISGIANVNENHWVTIVVDVRHHKIHYGDSLGGVGTELKAALRWWIANHVPLHFEDTDLEITMQSDSFNCSTFSLNSLEHAMDPERHPLISATSVGISCDLDRLSRFLNVCQRDFEVVSAVLNS